MWKHKKGRNPRNQDNIEIIFAQIVPMHMFWPIEHLGFMKGWALD
jgi:hypothetical protein